MTGRLIRAGSVIGLCTAMIFLGTACTEQPDAHGKTIALGIHYGGLPGHIYAEPLDTVERHLLAQLEPGDRYVFLPPEADTDLRDLSLDPRPLGAWRQIRALREIQRERLDTPPDASIETLQLQAMVQALENTHPLKCLYLAFNPDRLVPPEAPLARLESGFFQVVMLVPEDAILGGAGTQAWRSWLADAGADQIHVQSINAPLTECGTQAEAEENGPDLPVFDDALWDASGGNAAMHRLSQ